MANSCEIFTVLDRLTNRSETKKTQIGNKSRYRDKTRREWTKYVRPPVPELVSHFTYYLSYRSCSKKSFTRLVPDVRAENIRGEREGASNDRERERERARESERERERGSENCDSYQKWIGTVRKTTSRVSLILKAAKFNFKCHKLSPN